MKNIMIVDFLNIHSRDGHIIFFKPVAPFDYKKQVYGYFSQNQHWAGG